MNLREVHQILLNANVPWVAENPAIDVASLDQRRRPLGVPEIDLVRSLTAASRLSSSYSSSKLAPPAIDWRNNNGNWTGVARDQDTCLSCTAFAVCAVMEARKRIQDEAPSNPIDLSPGDLFFCGHTGGCAIGMYPDEALVHAKLHGVPREVDAPYDIASQSCRGASSVLNISDFSECPLDARSRKLVIAERGPVLGIMRVYDDFRWYEKDVYRHKTGDDEGLHAVAVIGYDDRQSCWICKNSWGPAFGENGYFRIGYGECELDQRPFVTLDVT